MDERLFYRPRDIYSRGHLSKPLVYTLIAQGVLPAVKFGRRGWYIPRRAFEAWLNSLANFLPTNTTKIVEHEK